MKELSDLLIRINLVEDSKIDYDVRWDVIDTLNNYIQDKQLTLTFVNQQRELFVAMFDKMNDDDIQECTNGFAGRVFDRVSNQ